MRLQSIADIAEICALKGVTKAILSPGSRCAPLTLAFVRHPLIETYTISDERAAAFIGVGMAQQLQQPVALICTSGSAAYNYAPAVAEAFYRNVPLLLLTADRPPEWIDQWDGQTIRQTEIYGKHIKKSFQLPVSFDHPDAVWHTERVISEAINFCSNGAKGPVHINVPLREPFYPSGNELYTFTENIKVISEIGGEPTLNEAQWKELMTEWYQFDKKLVIAGQLDPKSAKETTIPATDCVVAGDVIANLSGENVITTHDIFLAGIDEKLQEALKPDLIVTFGQSLISKNLKLFLRKHKPRAHWHISTFGEVGDPFQSLTKLIRATPDTFFKVMANSHKKTVFQTQKEENYLNIWRIEHKKAEAFINSFFPHEVFGEFEATAIVMKALPSGGDLHLANSMAVRYVSLLGTMLPRVNVYANRGTSGIDGSNSTAVGTALVSGRLTTLITGDMAFFYDRNAFWHNYSLKNLRVVVLNNHGGGIFRLISGPSEQPELEEYFETKQKLTAKNTAADFGFEYLSANNAVDLQECLKNFFADSDKPKLLEVFSDSSINQKIFRQFKILNKNNYGQ